MNEDLRSIGFSEIRERITGNRLAVYDALLRHGPCTGSELARAMGWEVTSVRPRLTELRDCFHAGVTGTRRDGEHEFDGYTVAHAMEMHAGARNAYANEINAQARERAKAISVGGTQLSFI